LLTTRTLLPAIFMVAAASIAGCSRRGRVYPSPPPTVQIEPPMAGTTAEASERTPPPTPSAPPPSLEVAPASPSATPGVPLAPLWDDLDSALAELDSALAGIEGWEVAAP
jgi:hypothetical protein